MDQFSHDLTLALEETSLMDRACGVGRWGSRRRTRSTGNLRKYLPLLCAATVKITCILHSTCCSLCTATNGRLVE